MPRLAASQGARLLLVDGSETAVALARPLTSAGYQVDRSSSSLEGLSLAVTDEYHLILLERALAEIDGLALVRILRACGVSTPALLLSANEEAEAHREALSAGADGHLVKPVAETALLARVAALARPPPRRRQRAILRVADLELDLEKRTAVRAGRPVRLAARDFDLLAYLVRHRGRAVTHASLLKNARGQRRVLGGRTLETCVERIRAEVDHGFEVQLIHTVPGVGYVLLDDD